ncbi:FkbM family methyltransferase [Methylotenera sp.]|uniref:FkbM family methyltransferase n=1 Tax=Methylotenera sp. TaxID=2051956 RepID=UPI0027326CD7|nr:FkbM family methyltransferase [Methylotenera sp.]MDP3211520.1 FkbM family methyltransferase [Methylotenera sp.]
MKMYALKKEIIKNSKVRSKAQFDEDLFLLKIFQNKLDGILVDVGANDGEYGSNSALLETIGWKCILIEPNLALCEKIQSVRNPYKLFQFAASSKDADVVLYQVDGGVLSHGLSTLELNSENRQRIEVNNFTYQEKKVRSRTLDSMLLESDVKSLDVVSIDVEGHELEVLKGISIEKWLPRIFIIEDNSTFISDEISSYMKSKNYFRFFRTGVNDWYAHKNDRELVNCSNKLYYQLCKYLLITKLKLSKVNYIKRTVKSIFK